MQNGFNQPECRQIVWSVRSQVQVQAVFDYLAEHWTDKQIHQLATQLEKTLTNIQANPKLYPIFSRDFALPVHRAIILKLNSLFYCFDETSDKIIILAFLDNRQNPKKINHLINQQD